MQWKLQAQASPVIWQGTGSTLPEQEQLERILSVTHATRFSLCAPACAQGQPATQEFVLLAVVHGNIYIDTDAITQGQLSSGQLLLLSAPFGVTAQENASCIAIAFTGSVAHALLADTLLQKRIFYPSGLLEASTLLQHLCEDACSLQEASAAAYAMLLRLYQTGICYQPQPGFPLLVETAIGIMQTEFAHLSGVEEVAERLQITSSHLIRIFSQAVGISPGRYLKQQRIACAKALLQHKHMTIALTADLTGFSSANYFAKVFRQEVGMSPHTYLSLHPQRTQAPAEMRQLLEAAYL